MSDSDEQRPDSLYLSPQAEQLFGYPPSAYLVDQELWRDNTHPDDRPLVAETWRQARAAGGPFECEYRIRHRDGRWIWLRDGAVPVREERYRALVENVPAVVYVVAPDDDRRTLYVSPHVERALGYTREEWLDAGHLDGAAAPGRPRADPGRPRPGQRDRAALEPRVPPHRERRARGVVPRPRHLVRDEEGRPLHWQGVQLDITELKGPRPSSAKRRPSTGRWSSRSRP